MKYKYVINYVLKRLIFLNDFFFLFGKVDLHYTAGNIIQVRYYISLDRKQMVLKIVLGNSMVV